MVIEGSTIQIPTVEEGAAALAEAGIVPGAPSDPTVAEPAAPAPASTGGQAGTAHVVQPGETLWSIAAANNFTTRTVAAFNGLSEDAHVIAGSTIQIPTVEQGAAALAEAGISPGSAAEPAAAAPAEPATTPGYAPGLTVIPSPYGDLHLDPAAAASWMAMREAAMASYGMDLYPGGARVGLPHLRAAGIPL